MAKELIGKVKSCSSCYSSFPVSTTLNKCGRVNTSKIQGLFIDILQQGCVKKMHLSSYAIQEQHYPQNSMFNPGEE